MDRQKVYRKEVSRMAEKNLQEELLDQITRVQELSDITAAFPGGQIAAAMMRQDISTAKEAMNHVDLAAMITACEALRGWEE